MYGPSYYFEQAAIGYKLICLKNTMHIDIEILDE